MLVIGAALMLSFPFRTRPATAAASVTYGFMLLLMCGLDNQHDMNAVQYFNKALSEVLSSATAVRAFRIVFPFNLLQAAFRVRRSMLQDLHVLVRSGRVMDETLWISRSLDRFAHLATRAEETTLDAGAAQRFLYGVLATLALGLNLLRLRRLMQDHQLPAPFSPVLEQVLHLFGSSRLNVEATLTHISKARQRLAQLAFEQETAEQERAQKISIRKDGQTKASDSAVPSLPVPRLGVAYALGCLLGIEQLVRENRAFLDSDKSIWSARDVGRVKMNM